MNPIVSEFMRYLAKEIASQVAQHLINQSPTPTPAAEPEPEQAEVFKPEVVADRTPEEWREDCLTLINQLAPTSRRPILAALGKFGGAKRLGEVQDADLPALLAELVLIKDAK